VGPEVAWLAHTGRAHIVSATDAEALEAFHLLARTEGILLRLRAPTPWPGRRGGSRRRRGGVVIVNLSGRGDKDLDTVLETMKKGGAR